MTYRQRDKRMHSDKRVVLLVSPHAGIIDTWLPVVHRLRNQFPGIRINAILPRPGETPFIYAADYSIRLFNSLIDSWIQALPTGNWVEFSEPRAIRPARFIARGIGRIRRLLGKGVVAEREQRAASLAENFRARFGKNFSAEVSTILCDVGDLRHPELGFLVRQFPNASIFSQDHGVLVRALLNADLEGPEIREQIQKTITGRNLTALLLAESERIYYRDLCGLEDSQMKARGPLQHDHEWLDFLLDKRVLPRPTEAEYIFLASRPISDNFMPRQMKYKILQMVRDYAQKEGLELVIRKHPSEQPRGKVEIEHGLGKPGRANGWIESAGHPVQLGFNAALNVTLYSSIAIDLVRIGQSVIEPIDFSDCRPETPNIRVDGNGRFVSFYQKEGLVQLARNQEEFKEAAQRIRGGSNDKKKVADLYRKHYADSNGAVTEVTALIADQSGKDSTQAVSGR